MARGKHKSRSANRQFKDQEEQIAALTEELAREQELLKAAMIECDRVDLTHDVLRTGMLDTAQEVGPQLSKLVEIRGFLRTVYGAASKHSDEIHDTWQKYSSQCIDLSPGRTGLERTEAFFTVLGLGGFMVDPVGSSRNSLTVEQATRLQRARGERTTVATTTPESRELTSVAAALDTGLLPLHRFQPLAEVGLWSEDQERPVLPASHTQLNDAQRTQIAGLARIAAKAANSKAGELTPEGIYVWGSSPLVTRPSEDGAILRALGFIGLSEEPPAERPGTAGDYPPAIGPLDATFRASRSPEEFIRAKSNIFSGWQTATQTLGTTTTAFSPIPLHSRPDRGISLQHAYVQSGLSSWLHHPEVPNAYALSTVRLANASTYWLPSGQTAAFADSEPLDDEDREEMSLPFSEVFLAFAEPLVLPANDTAGAEAQRRIRGLSDAAFFTLKHDSTAGTFLRRTVEIDIKRPTLEELLSHAGAKIEGVLLLADEEGSPSDLFAWCLTVPGEYGVTLGRFMIPASRTATMYRDLVDNLTAVVAWAQWHDPDQETTITSDMSPKQVRERVKSTDFINNAANSGVNIRVINVRGTSKKPGQAPPQKTPVRGQAKATPHVRRGHWRRQRFGAGREQIKRIRIAPLLVNAHRNDIELRVYRLPPVSVR